MGDTVYSLVLVGQGTSGDLARVVTALAFYAGASQRSLGPFKETRFWSNHASPALSGLSHECYHQSTKCFTLEWIQVFDISSITTSPPLSSWNETPSEPVFGLRHAGLVSAFTGAICSAD